MKFYTDALYLPRLRKLFISCDSFDGSEFYGGFGHLRRLTSLRIRTGSPRTTDGLGLAELPQL